MSTTRTTSPDQPNRARAVLAHVSRLEHLATLTPRQRARALGLAR